MTAPASRVGEARDKVECLRERGDDKDPNRSKKQRLGGQEMFAADHWRMCHRPTDDQIPRDADYGYRVFIVRLPFLAGRRQNSRIMGL